MKRDQRVIQAIYGFILLVLFWAHAHAETGLAGYWKFDENSGSAVLDSSGNSSSGTITGASWTTGQVGSALSFNGTDTYVDVGNPTTLRFTGAMTASAWVRVQSTSDNGRIVTKQGLSGNRGWSLNTESSGDYTFQIAPNGTTVLEVSTHNVVLNQWTHVVGVYDPSAALKIYLNGVLASQNTTSIPNTQYDSGLNVNIGRRPDSCCFFNGKIDEVRLYNRVLSASEVQSLYNAGANPDVSIPTATILSPSNNATVSGSLTISGTAADNVAVSKVEIKVDAGAYYQATGTASWTYVLDTLTISNGTHTVTARATDTSGNLSNLNSITISVSNDTTSPTVLIQSPLNNATVSGSQVISGTAADNISISKVEIKVDAGSYNIASGTTSWTYQLDTYSLTNGTHTVTARSTDGSGNTGTNSISVTVSNLATNSKRINVQGKLTDASGNPISGSKFVTFRLYQSTSDAVSAAIWSDVMGLYISNGLFNVTLGQNQSLDGVSFDRPLYVGFQIAGDSGEMIPRQALGASAYALGSVGNFNAGKSVYVTDKVGIGTTSPSEKLQVEGNALINGTIRGASWGFGGSYSVDSCGTNSVNNPLTSAASCPSGFTAYTIGKYSTPGTNCLGTSYICIK